MPEVHGQSDIPQQGLSVHRILLDLGCDLARRGQDLLVVDDDRSNDALRRLGVRPRSSFFAPTGGRRWLVLENANDPALPISR